MFFVFGSPRSGTTLIAQSLSAHPDIVIPNETDFIVPAAFVFDRIQDHAVRKNILAPLITKSRSFKHSIGEYVSPSDIAAIVEEHGDSLSDLLEAIFSVIALRGGGKIAGDKSPNDLQFMRMIEKMGALSAPTLIIHIIRDVRDVTASLVEQNWVEGIERQYPRIWSAQNMYLNSLLGTDPRYLTVKYENFVRQPDVEMRRMLDHLGCDYDPDTLDPRNRHPRLRGNPHHRSLYDPITAAMIGAYREKLAPDVLADCERQAREGIETFGYKLP